MQQASSKPRFKRSNSSATSTKTSEVVAKSDEFFVDRINGTSAPADRATSAISSLSVDTQTRSNNPLSRAAATGQWINGLSKNLRMFFRGIRLLPPLAGIIATGL